MLIVPAPGQAPRARTILRAMLGHQRIKLKGRSVLVHGQIPRAKGEEGSMLKDEKKKSETV